MYIGIKLQNLLKSKDLKQQALAKAMGIGAIHLSKRIGQEAKFSFSQISKAANFLGVKPEWLADPSRPFNVGDTLPQDTISSYSNTHFLLSTCTNDVRVRGCMGLLQVGQFIV